MGGLFAKPKITNHDRAVLDLKNQRDKLRLYSKKLEQIVEKDSETIKGLLKEGKRDKALLILKRKKYQENMLDKNQKLLDNIQEMVDNIQFARLEVKVFQGLREGAKTLKEIHQQIDIGELQNIMDDTDECIQKQKEIDELFTSKLTEEDEEDIMQELRSLQDEFQQSNELNIEEESESEEVKDNGKEEIEEDVEEEIVEEKNVKVGVQIEIKEPELSPLRRDDSMDELEALVNSMPNVPIEDPEPKPVVSPERILELDFA